jgi:hypothetical protein
VPREVAPPPRSANHVLGEEFVQPQKPFEDRQAVHRYPLDHVKNLGWTALPEAVILGEGGSNHVATISLLVHAVARVGLVDRQGETPLGYAQKRGYCNIIGALR